MSRLSLKDRNRHAATLYGQGKFLESLHLASEIAKENYPPAFLLIGLIHEFRPDSERNFELARQFYLKASTPEKASKVCIHLARVSMKLGDWQGAELYLNSALLGKTHPDDWFLAGDFYSGNIEELGCEGLPYVDLKKSSKYYLLAASRGRIVALRKYVLLKVRMNQPIKALVASQILVMISPVARIFLGARANYKY